MMPGGSPAEAEMGVVFDVKHFAVHDGPGIKTTIFLKGCPLRCAWCHSPESQSSRPEIAYSSDLCIGCGSCAEACYAGALTLYGRKATVEEFIEEVEKDHLIARTDHGL